MAEPDNIDLQFLARQSQRLIEDVGAVRDDIRVLAAIVMRLENSQHAMLEEMRAERSRWERLEETSAV